MLDVPRFLYAENALGKTDIVDRLRDAEKRRHDDHTRGSAFKKRARSFLRVDFSKRTRAELKQQTNSQSQT